MLVPRLESSLVTTHDRSRQAALVAAPLAFAALGPEEAIGTLLVA